MIVLRRVGPVSSAGNVGANMVGLLAILFLAALAGLIKPYIPGWRRLHFGVAAIGAFVLVGVFAPKTDKQAKDAATTATPTPIPSSGASDASGTVSEPSAVPSKWAYSEDKDSMRGTTTRYGSIDSENQVDLQFPYGTVRGTLTIRQRAEDGLQVLFSVEKGQVLCNSFTNTTVSMKFDDGPIQSFRCTGAADGSTETAFLQSPQRVLAALKKAKRAIVEAQFFQQGRQQFTFETAGLTWK